MCNADQPNSYYDDHDTCEMDEVNDFGDKFQALQKNVTLKIISGTNKDVSSFIAVDKDYIKDVKVKNFANILEVVKEFLKTEALKGVMATIMMLCDYTEDGLMCISKDTVPLEILEREIQLMLEGKQLLPMAVNLVVVKDGQYHQVSHIQPEDVNRSISRFNII